jgi:hypothetical protein
MQGFFLCRVFSYAGFFLRMAFSDLASPAEAGFAKVENRIPLFGIMRGGKVFTHP